MVKFQDYILVDEPDLKRFFNRIEDLCQKGYDLQGGFSRTDDRYYQAMVKRQWHLDNTNLMFYIKDNKECSFTFLVSVVYTSVRIGIQYGLY